jgi:NAD(P)-dependent dehydrogenase (short-subunit alcohol dehydrogenase family)
VITGAGRGIGAAGALALAQAGAEVVLLSRTREQLEETASRITDAGGHARAVVCDVTRNEQVRSAFGAMDRVDILLNNAGMNIPEPFVDVSEAHLDELIALNVRAAFFVSQAAVRKMLQDPERSKRGGSIINITSQMGRVGAERRTVYCMTKHAVEGLTKAMAVELAPENIRVNAIAPTFLETPMTASFFADRQFRDWVLSRIPLGRVGRMDDVTGAIVFLASPAASLITGTSLAVDGGWTAR